MRESRRDEFQDDRKRQVLNEIRSLVVASCSLSAEIEPRADASNTGCAERDVGERSRRLVRSTRMDTS